ncbi:ThuA domain-containing protein [Pelomonas sp. KK5]|uniref:ThuA domain-containing protein n=1 Tax=Pelomonas sp. KK5 TaxID=1855730 RepID=UPI00097C8025|nr:ThuA domain-containing protein [Pelomonas sp. KK5]
MNKRTTRPTRTVHALGAFALMAATGAFAQTAAPTNGNLPPGALPSSWDPTYNVCRGTDPKCYNNWIPTRQKRVLIFSRTAGPRHANLGTALAAGLNPPLNANNTAVAGLKAWLEAEGIQVDYTEEVTRLPGNSATYAAVIFMSPTRDFMQAHGRAVNPAYAVDTTTSAYVDQAKVNLRQYIRGGGGFVAIHNAYGGEYNWPWYEGLLGNANYYNHGAAQNGTVKIVGSADSSTAGLPASFGFHDEWYNLVPYPTNVKFLATVDESTLATKSSGHPGHGNFHPVAWCQYYDGGRAWLTTLGHDADSFVDGSSLPGQAQFKQLVVQGIKSAMGLTPFCTK